MFKLILITLSNLVITSSYSEEICTYMTGRPSTNSIEQFATSCSVQKEFAKDPEIEKIHRKNIHNKLADKLAKQIEQNSEEIATLTNYFNSKGHDLLMGSSDVANECKLTKINEIEKCSNYKKSPYFNDKLTLLKKHLPKSNTKIQGDTSLFGIIAGKFTADLKGEDNSCPLNKKSGVFLLQSQIDEKSALYIIETLSTSTSLKKDEELFKEYAQLKFLKDSGNAELIKDFKNHLKKIKAGTAAEHISDFFFNPENQKKMIPALTNQCKKMNKNIEEFLCSDMTELASNEEKISKDLFSQLGTDEILEKQYEVDLTDPSVLTAYGMQCLAKEKKKNQKIGEVENLSSLDNWYKNFTNNTRIYDGSNAEAAGKVENFCNLYECKGQEVQATASCKSGGPVTSTDLIALFKCDDKNLYTCNEQRMKTITMLQAMEKIKGKTSESLANNSNNFLAGDKKNIARLPGFAENYLGVESSLRALGKPVTPEIIAEKTKEHEEKIRTMEDSRLAAKDEATSPIPTIKPKEQTAGSDVKEDTYSVAEAQNEFRANRSGNNNFNSAIRTAPTKTEETKRSPIIAKNENSDNLKEAQRMREEMEKLIAGMKGAGQDSSDLESQLAEMKSVTGKKMALGSNSGPNKAEEERLKRWDQTLKDRSRDLDQYRRELDERRYYNERGSARDESGRVPTAKNGVAAQDADKGDRDISGGSSGSGGAGGIKLTGSSQPGKVEQRAETAAIIQSGKESSTMTTDELTRLSPENLEKHGIDASRPFTLRVNFNNKTYDIPVKNFSYKGSTILGPIVDKKNKELNGFLLKSPLFKKYYDYQLEASKNR